MPVILRPPCWPPDGPCPNPCAAQHYQRVVYNDTPLSGPWAGWRLAGARLVSRPAIGSVRTRWTAGSGASRGSTQTTKSPIGEIQK